MRQRHRVEHVFRNPPGLPFPISASLTWMETKYILLSFGIAVYNFRHLRKLPSESFPDSPVLELLQVFFVDGVDQYTVTLIIRRSQDNMARIIVPFDTERAAVSRNEVIKLDLRVFDQIDPDLGPWVGSATTRLETRKPTMVFYQSSLHVAVQAGAALDAAIPAWLGS